MKRKTFIVTLLLFMIFMNSSMLIVSFITLRERMAAERETVLAEHYVISSGLIGDMQAVQNRGGDVRESMGDLMRTYARYSQKRDNAFAVSCEGDWIWYSGNTAPAEDPGGLAGQTDQSERMVFVRRKPEWQLCVYGRFPAPFQEYGLWYCAGLSDTFEAWRGMKNMLFTVSMTVTFILALFLVKFLDILFRPLREISAASRVIAEGDYHTRLPVRGKDEIALMAEHFNRMAEQVESHIKLLQETADKKQQFVDNFAHELRTPLTAIYGYAEYLQKAPATEKERFECTQFILSECGRLQNMAYQLLDLAALRELKTEVCSVDSLFQRVREIMQVKAEKSGIALFFSGSGEYVIGNTELLITLLSNLMDNAFKASEEGSAVRVSAERKEDKVIFEVKDQGIGMTREQIDHIKEAFYRVDKSRSRAAGGAGLGLSICDRIVELHGGSLEFTSEPGRGTVAQVILPGGEEETGFTTS